jgi:glucokinase-like ROK family protein
MYGINPNSRFIVAINIGLGGSEIAVFNLSNKLIHKIQFLQIPIENSPGFIEQVYNFTTKLLGKYKISPQQVLGIGIAIPGLTDPISGKSLSYLNYSEYSIKELFEEKFGKPVFVDNDARVMAHAEHIFGLARNKDNVLCLNIGAGIGMGMILNKKLYHGQSGFAGEFGHIKVEENDELCICGKRGCLETVASGDALIHKTLAEIRAGKSTKILSMIDESPKAIRCSTVIEAAHQDDQLAIDLLGSIGEYLGKGLATLIHIFNPETIILGGKLAPAKQFIIDPIKQALNKHTISHINKDTSIQTSTLGDKAAVMGAMALVMDNIFEDVVNNAIV